MSLNIKYDVILANHREFFESLTRIEKTEFNFDVERIENSNLDEFLFYLFSELKGFNKAVWAHAYRTDFIKKKQLYFDEELSRNEDGDWCFKVFLATQKKTAINHSTYLYRRDNSLSVSNTKENIKNFLSSHIVYTRWKKFFQDEYVGDLSKDIMIAHLAEGYTNLGTYIYDLDKNERQKAIDLFKTNSDILKCSNRRDHILLYFIYKVFGINSYLLLINRLRRFKAVIK
jgi:hypothetical protein